MSSQSTCLVIPDIHQHIEWADKILSREADQAEHIVLLGDYFDPKVGKARAAKDTAAYIQRIAKRYRQKISFLVGNHDLPYLYDFQNPDALKRGEINPYTCSGYKSDRSKKIAAKLSREFVSLLQPFILIKGQLLSHAGLHAGHFPDSSACTIEQLQSLKLELKNSLMNLAAGVVPALAAVSFVRGGTAPLGGVTWLDWGKEFEDNLPWPQIVGHTIQDQEPSKKGRSWNLDTRAGHYALLTDEGVTIKREKKE